MMRKSLVAELCAYLATILGYSKTADIRKSVKRHRTELEALGSLRLTGAMIETGKGAKRQVQEFHLNERQAFFLSSRARTPMGKALAVWQSEASRIFAEAIAEGRIKIDAQTVAELQAATSAARQVYLEDAAKHGGIQRMENDACFGKDTKRLL